MAKRPTRRQRTRKAKAKAPGWRDDDEAAKFIAAAKGDDVRPWQQLQPATLPEHELERARVATKEMGGVYRPPDEVWMNDEYQCFVTYLEPRGKGGTLSLSIKRNDRQPVQDWRDKQAIKNEVAGWEREAIELYPAESRLVDDADQCWLWVLPAGDKVGTGFLERRIGTPEADDHRAKTGKGSQRDWRPGISTGPDYDPRRP